MADIRMVFNGPFAHKEGPNYQWVAYTGKIPYPRPGTVSPTSSDTTHAGLTVTVTSNIIHLNKMQASAPKLQILPHAPVSLSQCPGGTFTPNMKSTKDYADEVINFMRNHPAMYNAVYPVHKRPLVVRTNVDYEFTTITVDQVTAADGNYEVLFLGTGECYVPFQFDRKEFLSAYNLITVL